MQNMTDQQYYITLLDKRGRDAHPNIDLKRQIGERQKERVRRVANWLDRIQGIHRREMKIYNLNGIVP